MNTDKELTPEIIADKIENLYVKVHPDSKIYSERFIEEYGQQERELQKKEDDLAIHAAYNYGYKRGKKEANEWVSVDERLPVGFWTREEPMQDFYRKYSEQVNIYVDNGTVGSAAYNRETKKWFVGDLTENGYQELHNTEVTHWMPLPAPPQQGKESGNDK